MIPGVLGMLLICWGLSSPAGIDVRWLFFLGALGMTATALIERHALFVGLQGVILGGTIAAFLPIQEELKTLIPLVVSVPILWLLKKRQFLQDANTWLGAVSLTVLGIAYAAQQPLAFLLGGVLVSVFSYIEWRRGFSPAVVWLALNVLFSVLAARNVLA